MPPALSDEENGASSGEEEVPYRGKGKAAAAAADPEEEEDEAEGDDDGEEEEYVVEKIMSHAFGPDNVCLYEVKWMGYEAKKDRTWEPEDNLSGATEVLHEYFEEIGGRPKPGGTKGKKRKGRKSNADVKSESGTPAAARQSNKKPKREKEWSPPPGSWENDVDHVDTVEESLDGKTGQLVRFAYIVWNNQKKTQHPLQHIYRKCPQKMLEYYESHLVFTQQDTSLNGHDKDIMMKGDDY